jgi:2-oxoglutarate dehydrogenase E2 component (dihydrolipoamide succinyltransferase)
MAEEIVVPTLGESITEATIGRWLKQVGEAVAEDEAIVELETDKVAMEVNSPVSGVMQEIISGEGDTVEVGAVIARVDISGAAPTVKSEAKAAPAPIAAPTPQAAAPAAPAPGTPGAPAGPMAPAVRKLVGENNLDPNKIVGSGKNGRITKADVLKAIEAGSAAAPSLGAGAGVAVAAETGPREERVPMSRMRKRIAERLKEAQNTAAMLTTYNEVDMTSIMDTRARYRDMFEKKHGIRLGFMSFFAKAACLALKEVPAVNAQIDGDEMVYYNYCNIGVAVSSPNGLVVPVVKDAQNLSFADTEKSIIGYALKARAGKLALDDMMGGTFTITNGGVFGSLLSSPILNTPQSGILGMHKIQKRPMVMADGSIEARPMMYLALSYDHRIIDGKEAVTFLVRIKECIEDPERIMLDL